MLDVVFWKIKKLCLSMWKFFFFGFFYVWELKFCRAAGSGGSGKDLARSSF